MMDIAQHITHLAQHAPGFAARLQAAGLSADRIKTIDDLNALPVFRKDDLAALQAAKPPFGGLLNRRGRSMTPNHAHRITGAGRRHCAPLAFNPVNWC
jgi:phenylacetate-coenzyme A ligase PaaK-like adenylate-forming protein